MVSPEDLILRFSVVVSPSRSSSWYRPKILPSGSVSAPWYRDRGISRRSWRRFQDPGRVVRISVVASREDHLASWEDEVAGSGSGSPAVLVIYLLTCPNTTKTTQIAHLSKCHQNYPNCLIYAQKNTSLEISCVRCLFYQYRTDQ